MRALLPALLLCAAGCGSLNDGPLEVGEVQGSVANADANWQQVDDVSAGLAATFAADGTFTLANVPVGTAQLFVVATPHSAALVATPITGGQVTSLGAIATSPAGNVTVHLNAPGLGDPQDAAVDIDDTPYSGKHLDSSGNAQLGPLPDGCYSGEVRHPTAGSSGFSFCMSNGSNQAVEATLP